ncbi:MAG: hypothetical protein J6Z82_02455 [Schwartzia sp.]|nr:hypothetical protein [Schwartzia sp. (in: firmicutes)]
MEKRIPGPGLSQEEFCFLRQLFFVWRLSGFCSIPVSRLLLHAVLSISY